MAAHLDMSSLDNAGSEYTLTPHAVLRWPCGMPGCDTSLDSHQCLPGAASLLSRDIVAAVHVTHGRPSRERVPAASCGAGPKSERCGAVRASNGPRDPPPVAPTARL